MTRRRRLLIGVLFVFLVMGILACEPLDPLGVRRAVE
jgi:hypothetical protein